MYFLIALRDDPPLSPRPLMAPLTMEETFGWSDFLAADFAAFGFLGVAAFFALAPPLPFAGVAGAVGVVSAVASDILRFTVFVLRDFEVVLFTSWIGFV